MSVRPNKKTPVVANGRLVDANIPVDSSGWFAWLSSARRFYFEGERGSFTARREQRRGHRYWIAYHKTGDKLNRVHLGKDEALTLDALNEAAARLRNKVAVVLSLAESEPVEPHRKYAVLVDELKEFIFADTEAQARAVLKRHSRLLAVVTFHEWAEVWSSDPTTQLHIDKRRALWERALRDGTAGKMMNERR